MEKVSIFITKKAAQVPVPIIWLIQKKEASTALDLNYLS